MKKGFLVSLAFFLLFPVHSATLPQSLYGLWEGKDRYIFFEKDQTDENPYLFIVLKTYYGWYLNRAAEAKSYSEKYPRSRNTADSKSAELVALDFQSISKSNSIEEENSPFAGELILNFSKHDQNKIALAVFDEKLYLNFFIQDQEDKNYYRGNASSDGIKLSPQATDRNIGGLYISNDRIYDIRYWISDMDYSEEKALVKYKEDEFYVDKHLFSCGNNYSATSGRSNKVRNVVAPLDFKSENYIFSEDKKILVTDKEAYLIRLADKSSLEALMEIILQANSRVKAPAQPPFPPSNLDWHWDLIDQLESGNLIIQELRQRQADFGPRGKDFNR
ncbi:MAG: hypothetical protein K5681_04935 [Treponema sp.]|nr:hypothetical protein [Treponema sp.]